MDILIEEKYNYNFDKDINKLKLVPVVKNLLKYVPKRWLEGIKNIYITDTKNFNRNDIRYYNKKKYLNKVVLGTYENLKDNKGIIIIYVDNILKTCSYNPLIAPLTKYFKISEILYHEIGHHIHNTIKPEFKEKENTANYYKEKLHRSLIRKRYWYLIIFLFPLILINYFKKKL
jgi:hypothetical protein